MLLVDAAVALTTPRLPEHYLAAINPLWARHQPRGRVESVMPETPDAATLWIRPGAGFPRDHTPGQYVRIGVDVDGRRHWRTYSLTSLPRRSDGRFSITVKAMPGGVVSNELVFATPHGAIVRLAPPAGEFVLPEDLRDPILFITAGSGITPVMGMLRALAAAGPLRDVAHVHLAPSQQEAIFGFELRRLARRHPGYALREHFDDRDGIWGVAALDRAVPDWRARQAWACGPAGLLDALRARFEDEELADRLHLEHFRPVVAAAGLEGGGGRVRFMASGREIEADGATPLLVAGEEAGVLLPHGCRMGICHTCVGRLHSGAVRDLRTGELHETPDELVRTCICAPAGAVEIDL
jgi:ferredoxin-NADP reductase